MLKGLAIAGTELLTAVGGAVMLSSGTGCTTQTIDPSLVSATTVAGYSGDQLAHAAIIMNAATTAGLGQQVQVIAVMTAITETNLQNTATGDFASRVADSGKTDTALRGDYSAVRADYTIDQGWDRYTDTDHAMWRTIYARPTAILARSEAPD